MIHVTHPFRKVRAKDEAPRFLLCRHQGESDFPLASRAVGSVLSPTLLVQPWRMDGAFDEL